MPDTREVKIRANKSTQMTLVEHGTRRVKRETYRGFWCET